MTKVLLVDDYALIRNSISLHLQMEGFEVIAARNGVDALSKLTSGIDCVVTDIIMPEMDGLELAKTIRESPRQAVPIIVMSADRRPQVRQAALDAGANRFLIKSIDTFHKNLVLVLQELLSK